MSEKHTPGLADAQRWMGVDTDPRWTVTLGGAVRFITAGDNDENNAIECKRRWNSHDALLEACKAVRFDILDRPTPYIRIKTLKKVQAAIAQAEKEG